MARELYALLTPTPFCLPNNLGQNAVYVQVIDPNAPNAVPNPAPLTRTEQATIDMTLNPYKHYFLLMRKIKQACFTMLDLLINHAFKVSNNPTIQGWHAGMSVMYILDQLSNLY
jgi:hypothetical protein